MIIHTYEDGGRTEACKERLEDKLESLGVTECVILPIPSSRDGIHLSGSNITLESVLDDINPGMLVVGYSIPEDTKRKIEQRGGILYDASEDEAFLVGNAELTAIATVGILLTTEQRVPSEMSFGIVGYGRIGRELVRYLLFFGAKVRVFTRRRDVRLLLSEFCVATSDSVSGIDLSGIDVLINTAPAQIFDTDSALFPKAMRVIDLASGNNFPSLLAYETYPSIPAKMYPKSSGELLADGALAYVKELFRKQSFNL